MNHFDIAALPDYQPHRLFALVTRPMKVETSDDAERIEALNSILTYLIEKQTSDIVGLEGNMKVDSLIYISRMKIPDFFPTHIFTEKGDKLFDKTINSWLLELARKIGISSDSSKTIDILYVEVNKQLEVIDAWELKNAFPYRYFPQHDDHLFKNEHRQVQDQSRKSDGKNKIMFGGECSRGSEILSKANLVLGLRSHEIQMRIMSTNEKLTDKLDDISPVTLPEVEPFSLAAVSSAQYQYIPVWTEENKHLFVDPEHVGLRPIMHQTVGGMPIHYSTSALKNGAAIDLLTMSLFKKMRDDTATAIAGKFQQKVEMDNAYVSTIHVRVKRQNDEGLVDYDNIFKISVDVPLEAYGDTLLVNQPKVITMNGPRDSSPKVLTSGYIDDLLRDTNIIFYFQGNIDSSGKCYIKVAFDDVVPNTGYKGNHGIHLEYQTKLNKFTWEVLGYNLKLLVNMK